MAQSEESIVKSGPLAWMVRNTVAANLLMVIFLLGGFIMSRQAKQEVFPEFTTDIVRISVPYPGASPEEVEQGILLSVEDGVRGLEGVKEVTSVAAEGAGTVVVELLASADKSKVVQDIKNEVDRITSFPEDAERPLVSLLESRRRVVSLLVYGDQDRRLLRQLAERVRGDLIQSDGVTLVELGLAPPLEISIEIAQSTLRKYGITLEEVASIVRRTALELPAGEVKTAGGQILLRTYERRDFGREFANIVVTTDVDGTQVTVGDIASIDDSFRETNEEAFYQGKPAVFVYVYRVGDETPQSVSQAVREYMKQVSPELPEGTGFKIWRDSSLIYQDRMHLLMKNAVLGLTLVLILLGLFLEVRLAFWVTLGIPISVLGSFLFLPFTGASINMISLFAFIVTLGIIVDDAVVTGENIYEKREKGLSPYAAAVAGVREIAMPVTFAVLTNIVAFMPLFFVPGVSGKFFRQIPAVVVFVFLVSLIESLFVLPSHLSHSLGSGKIWEKLNRPKHWCSKRLEYFTQEIYQPAIGWVIRHRYQTFAVAIACLLIARGAVVGGHLRFTFLPKIDADLITAQATLPFGVPMQESRRVQELLISAAERSIEEGGGDRIAEGIYSQIGGALIQFGGGPAPQAAGSGSHLVAAQVSLVSSDQRDISGTEFAKIWRKEVGEIVGMESLVFKAETGASEGPAIEFNLNHRSRETAESAARELVGVLRGYRGVIDTDDGVATGKPQLSFRVSDQGRAAGLTARELGRQVRSAYYGAEALRQQRGRNEVKVMVRLPKSERSSLNSLDDFIIRTPDNAEMELSRGASVTEGRSYTEINRLNGRRIVAVTADVDENVANANQIIEQVVADHIPALQEKYPGLQYSFGGEREAQQNSLRALGSGFVIALLVIYALLAVPFRSYLQPAIVMLSIPFGIIGAIGGHFLLGYGLSIISLFGIIALSGVVVNDSLVLIVTANRLREEGVSAEEAVRRAGMRRLRPILLTSLTTFFGLAPMIFETSLQARFLIPMAISIGFGILFSTVIILAIVPAVYLIVEDVAFSAQRVKVFLAGHVRRLTD